MKQIPFSPPDITKEDIEAVVETLKSGWLTTGPKTKLFEQQLATYCHSNKVVCLNSATAGLELILRALGVGPGDEVITSAYTYTASASVICHVGATPVMVDVAEGSYHIDTNKIEKAISSKTKAIIAVDIAGIMCDYDAIFEVVNKYENDFVATSELQKKIGHIVVIADAAHSFGATYKGKQSGTVADFSSFSFHAVKNLTTGEGGAVTWKANKEVDDEELYKTFMLLSLHGQNKDALAKTKSGGWGYDIVMPGYKCNMADLMASLGISQLKRYDEILKTRKRIVDLYDTLLKDAPVEAVSHNSKDASSSYHLYLVGIPGITESQRSWVIQELVGKGIITNVHYKPLPMHSAYKNLGFDMKDYPNAYNMYQKEVTLPLYTLLTEEEVAYIVKVLKEVISVIPKE